MSSIPVAGKVASPGWARHDGTWQNTVHSDGGPVRKTPVRKGRGWRVSFMTKGWSRGYGYLPGSAWQQENKIWENFDTPKALTAILYFFLFFEAYCQMQHVHCWLRKRNTLFSKQYFLYAVWRTMSSTTMAVIIDLQLLEKSNISFCQCHFDKRHGRTWNI